MIRKAKIDDIDSILSIVKAVVAEMKNNNNDQWSDVYPVYADFADDIASDGLVVDVNEQGVIMSFVCLNTVEPAEYKTIPWNTDQKALIIHRLAVNPLYRGRGLAEGLMIYAEKIAEKSGLNYLRSDTCVQNPVMNSLFVKMKYRKSGMLRFSDSEYDFNCYEKILN